MTKDRKKGTGWIWTAMLSLGAGYFLTFLLFQSDYADRAPVLATVLAVGITMMVTRKTPGVVRGAMRGVAIGVAVGMGVAMAIMAAQTPPPAEGMDPVVTDAQFIGSVVMTTTSTPGPGPAPAGAMFLAIATPRVQPRMAPPEPDPIIAFALLIPTACCLIAGGVSALAAKRREED